MVAARTVVPTPSEWLPARAPARAGRIGQPAERWVCGPPAGRNLGRDLSTSAPGADVRAHRCL